MPKVINDESERSTSLNVSMPQEMKDWLNEQGRAQGSNGSAIVRLAVIEYRKKKEEETQ